VEAPRARLLVLPDELLEAVPTLSDKHSFTASGEGDDVVFAKNQEQQYHTPAMDLPWPDKSKSHHGFDKNLARIQERLAFTTRPVDEFAADAFAFFSDLVQRRAILDFVQIVRSQLAITARQITKKRARTSSCRPMASSPHPTRAKEQAYSSQVQRAPVVSNYLTPPIYLRRALAALSKRMAITATIL
ncbi:hypothetical protein BGZ94_006377, partial [Podila epigama]